MHWELTVAEKIGGKHTHVDTNMVGDHAIAQFTQANSWDALRIWTLSSITQVY